MSSRQLRKLRKQQELLDFQEATDHVDGSGVGDDDDDDEPVPAPSFTKPKLSGFAALAEQDEDDVRDEPEDDDETVPGEVTSTTIAEEATPVKSKKHKKKKKKTKKGNATNETGTPVSGGAELDEIDRAIKELQLEPKLQASRPVNYREGFEGLAKVLRINFQHLKMLSEMRRLFGKEAIDAAEADDSPQANAAHGRRQRRGAQQTVDLETFLSGQPGKSLPEVMLRRNPFVNGKKKWPQGAAGGLFMVMVADDGATTEFSFAHDKNYNLLESQFFFTIGMHDPNMFIHFLHKHSYHVSTLIQMTKVAQHDQNAALASDLCERALFTFGRVTLSAFRKKLEEGKARLDFLRPENRQFWLAGHHYIKHLIRKGTYRTALEWAKLLLSIDPKDPYGMLNWIHVLAIRSHEAQWFVDLCNSDLLAGTWPEVENGIYARQTVVLAKLQLGDREGARAFLIDGMQRLPWLYNALLSKLNIDPPAALWGVLPRDDDTTLFTELYLHLATDLWNIPEAKGLMLEAGRLLYPAKFSTLADTQLTEMQVSLATARFVYLDNTPDLMARVPRNMLHASPNFDFDPLPPPAEQNIFSDRVQALPWHLEPREANPVTDVAGEARDLLPQAAADEFEHLLDDFRPTPRERDRQRLIADEIAQRLQIEAERENGEDAQTMLQRLRGLIQGAIEGELASPAEGRSSSVIDNERMAIPGAWMDDDDADADDDDFLDAVEDFHDTADDFEGLDDFGDARW